MPVPSSKDELQDKRFGLALLAEFAGTLLYVLIGCGIFQENWFVDKTNGDVVGISQENANKTTATGEITNPLSVATGEITNPLSVAAGFGLAAGTLLWVFQHVSGGHFNPAVSFGFLVTRRISLARGFFYIAAQVVGGILGNLILKGLSGKDATLGILKPMNDYSVDKAFGVELFITIIFVFAYFASNDSGRKELNGSAPITIGLAAVLVHLFALKSTGAGLNPARAFAPAVVTPDFDSSHWIYWIGPLLGALISAFLYEFLFASNSCVNKFLGFFRLDYDNDNDFSCAPKSDAKEPAADDAEAPAEAPVENGKEGDAEQATKTEATKTEA